MRFLKNNISTLIAIAILLSLGFKLIKDLKMYTDIGLFDETGYLYGGVMFFKSIPRASLAPLYSFWYWVLNLIISNRVELYYINYQILVMVPVLLFFFMLKSYTKSTAISLLLAIFFMTSSLNLLVWPHVSSLCLCLILIVITIVGTMESRFKQLLLLVFAALLCSYIRPEYYICFIIFFLTVLFYVIVRLGFKMLPEEIFWLCLFMLVAISLHVFIGFPIFSSDRDIVAFGQHFALNVVQFKGLNINPWTNWSEIFNQSFGNAHTISEAIFAESQDVLLALILEMLQILLTKGLFCFSMGVFQARSFQFQIGLSF